MTRIVPEFYNQFQDTLELKQLESISQHLQACNKHNLHYITIISSIRTIKNAETLDLRRNNDDYTLIKTPICAKYTLITIATYDYIWAQHIQSSILSPPTSSILLSQQYFLHTDIDEFKKQNKGKVLNVKLLTSEQTMKAIRIFQSRCRLDD